MNNEKSIEIYSQCHQFSEAIECTIAQCREFIPAEFEDSHRRAIGEHQSW